MRDDGPNLRAGAAPGDSRPPLCNAVYHVYRPYWTVGEMRQEEFPLNASVKPDAIDCDVLVVKPPVFVSAFLVTGES